MTTMDKAIPLGVAMLLIAAGYVCMRLSSAAQPLRLDLAQKGEAFLMQEGVSPAAAHRVQFLLDGAFQFRVPLIAGIIGLPLFLMLLVVRRDVADRIVRRTMNMTEVEYQKVQELSKLHDRITLANHPILTIVFEGEMLLLLPLTILVVAIFRGRMPRIISRDWLASVVETKPADFRHLMAA